MNSYDVLVGIWFEPFGRIVYVLNFGDDADYALEAIEYMEVTEPWTAQLGEWRVLPVPQKKVEQALARMDIEALQSLGCNRFYRGYVWCPPTEGFYADPEMHILGGNELVEVALAAYTLSRCADRLNGVDPDADEFEAERDRGVPAIEPRTERDADKSKPTVVSARVDALDEHDVALLAFLNRNPSLRRKVSEVLPEKGPQDRKAVAKRLRKLADRTPALVDYPKNGRSGVVILPAGAEALKRATAPTPR